MRHWITDVQLVTQGQYDSGSQTSAWYVFHFLRLLDWKIVAECDNSSITVCSHITDGCMDDAGVTNWSVVGTATRAKSDVQKYSGYRSLTFTTAATGDGIQSASFVSMAASKVYVFTVWVWNNCGHQLKVYIDNGNGSYALAGVVPDNGGVWTKYQFGYTSHSTVTNCKFKIVSEDGTVSAGQVYVDSCYTYRSLFEAAICGSGTDGVIEAGNNKFSSASYTFTSADILAAYRVVCFVDLVNEGNSGIYKIIGLDGTKAILDIRDDGTSFLAAATGLAFRVLDRADIPNGLTSPGVGFCLESPHESKWRWKFRCAYGSWGYGSSIGSGAWASSPEDCALNIDTFQFYTLEQRSTSRYFMPDTGGVTGSPTGMYGLPWTNSLTQVAHKFYFLTDGLTYIFGVHRRIGPDVQGAWLMGFLGDAYMEFKDTFVHLQQQLGTAVATDTLQFSTADYCWSYYGSGFSPTRNGRSVQASLGSAGFGTAAGVTEYMTNAKANPWSGVEPIRPFFVFLDWPGNLGAFSVMESTNQNFGHCRANLPLWAPFGGSRDWFHTKNGLCIAWHGREVAP